MIVEEIPEGRQRGKLVYLKEGLCFCIPRFYRACRLIAIDAPSRDTRHPAPPLDTPSTRRPRPHRAGKFGFIRPRDAKSKDDHAFFNMNELCASLSVAPLLSSSGCLPDAL